MSIEAADDLLRICSDTIDLNEVYTALASPECGAQLVFIGVVRQENEGRQVRAVSYEAYLPLAETVLKELAAEARTRVATPLRVAIAHRTGTLKVGEMSTVIGVASPHRAGSYEASRYLIEQLKLRTPIWKEEHYVDGQNSWLDGAELTPQNCSDNPGRRSILTDGTR